MVAANTLGVATSPYLRQHAGNPVHWQQWTPDSLAEAVARDVPVLLSIGYAACHWCHVMAHESFDDDDVAAVLNAGFVCIKVDREERPDLDAVYMTATVALTGQGGWPMTCFLTPDGRPFLLRHVLPKGCLSAVARCRRRYLAAPAFRGGTGVRRHRERAGVRWRRVCQVAGPALAPEVCDRAVAGVLADEDVGRGGFGPRRRSSRPRPWWRRCYGATNAPRIRPC